MASAAGGHHETWFGGVRLSVSHQVGTSPSIPAAIVSHMSDEGLEREDEAPEAYFARADAAARADVLMLSMSDRLARLHHLLLELGPVRGAAQR
jgi:hypothetical protein